MATQPAFPHGLEHASASDLDRFAGKVSVSDGCWIWLGTKDTDGYGVFKINRRMYKSHRLSFKFAFGWLPIPPGNLICHKCDNRACVNPAHLFAGRPCDNSFDMVSKGRSARGERGSHSRLTTENVHDILRRLDAGEPKKAIARQFGVSDTAIRYIAQGKAWRHVTMEDL